MYQYVQETQSTLAYNIEIIYIIKCHLYSISNSFYSIEISWNRPGDADL